jgi:hypothetical protein
MDRKKFLKTIAQAGLLCCGSGMAAASKGQSAEGLSKDLAQRMKKGAESSDWRKADKARRWIKDMMDNMDSRLDLKTKKELMQACGRSCFDFAYGVAPEAKPTPEQAENYLKNLEKSGYKILRQGKTITVDFNWGENKQNPWGLSVREGYCLCPIFESRDHPVSPTYCLCSTGYIKAGFERSLGKKVEVEVLESIKMGGKDCRFKVTIHD